MLSAYGYVELDAWKLTEAGEMLARTFHECDLLVAEIVRAGLLDGIGPADLAALVSVVVYEHRSPEPPPPVVLLERDPRRDGPGSRRSARSCGPRSARSGLAEHRAPDPTFAAVAHAWVAGEGFAEVITDEELTGGDFVRAIKQLIDILRQLAIVAPSATPAARAAAAAQAAFRGVVADSSAPTEAVAN